MQAPERHRAPHAAFSAICLVVAIGCAGVAPRAASGNAGSAQPAGGSGGGSAGGSGGRPARGSGGAPDAGGTSADAGSPIPPLTDFPPAPIIDTGAPPNAATLFSTSGRTAGAPCVLSPEAGTLRVKAGVIEVVYPALYLWNQPASDDNHTPSWDDYQIPSINIG